MSSVKLLWAVLSPVPNRECLMMVGKQNLFDELNLHYSNLIKPIIYLCRQILKIFRTARQHQKYTGREN